MATEPPNKCILRSILTFLLHQWLLIGMGIACVLAYYFPSVAKHGGTIRAEYTILYGAMALIFLISGLTIPRDKLLRHARNIRLHLLVQSISFLLVPALLLAIVHLILAADSSAPAPRIDPALLAGYLFTAAIPTTIASNVVMTRAARGDDAAALVEVLLANALGPFLSPAWTLAILPRAPAFDPWRAASADLAAMYRDVFRQLGLGVLLPLVVGQAVRWSWPEATARVVERARLAKVGSFCMLLLVWSTFSSCFATGALQSLAAESIAFVVCFNVGLYLCLTGVSFGLCRLPELGGGGKARRWVKHAFRPVPPEETIAVCFCAPAKSTSLGIPLLYAMWAPLDLLVKAKTSVPVLLYTTEQICVAHVLVQVFRRWRARMDNKREEESETTEGRT
ncbi:putative sodium bile acid cotransporter [Aspergillus floccosus]